MSMMKAGSSVTITTIIYICVSRMNLISFPISCGRNRLNLSKKKSSGRVTLNFKNDPIGARRRLQPEYNSKGQYLPVFRKSRFHMLLFIKYLCGHKKMQTFSMHAV